MERDNEQFSLADQLEEVIDYERATPGQRFLNYLIDNLLMRFALSWVTGAILGFLLVALAPEFYYNLDLTGEVSADLILLTYGIAVFNYLTYYTFCEKVFNGVTLGKAVTKTKVIREDGHPLTWRDCFLRSLSRLVPFEPFSAFGGTPWHDTWTKTAVVKTR